MWTDFFNGLSSNLTKINVSSSYPHGLVRFSYNPSFSGYFFSRNSISACFFSEANGAYISAILNKDCHVEIKEVSVVGPFGSAVRYEKAIVSYVLWINCKVFG